MTDQSKWNITISGGNNINNHGGIFRENSIGGIINTGFQKTCCTCQEIVGLHYPNNCQCEKKNGHCEYCQFSDTNKKNCSCQKEKQVNKLEEKITQSKKEGKSNDELQGVQTQEITSKIKNILLIGRTGSGKSTLGNILTNTNNFQESPFSISETRKLQTGAFIYSNRKYQVIDTIGISDTQLTEEQILEELLRAIHTAKDGIHQIFLTISSKLTKEEIAIYHLLRDVIFTKDIASHITIVRTNFPDFQDQQKCNDDREKIKKESEQLSDIANFSKIIYVNNPPIDIQTRENSRTVLLEYLTGYMDVYKSTQLDELVNNISDYINKVEKLEIIEAKSKEVKNKPNNKKEVKQIEKVLSKTHSEKELVLKEIMRQMEKKKEWKEWKKWAKEHGIEVVSLGMGVAALVVPLACRVM